VRARLGTLECSLVNLSETGAMVRSRRELPVGHEAPLVIEIQPKPVSGRVRVMRCEPVDVALPGAVWRQHEQALGVLFLQPSAELRHAVRKLMKEASGIEHASPRVLVVGEDDAIARLIDRTLRDADYVPRFLADARYAIGMSKRAGAKAILINLQIDPEFSARAILDALRADPFTAGLPVIVCARQAWLRPSHRDYLAGKRLRLLLVPFTPEELVLTLDRAMSEGY